MMVDEVGTTQARRSVCSHVANDIHTGLFLASSATGHSIVDNCPAFLWYQFWVSAVQLCCIKMFSVHDVPQTCDLDFAWRASRAAHDMCSCPERVLLCVLPVTENNARDHDLHIHHTLITAFCTEHGIRFLKVGALLSVCLSAVCLSLSLCAALSPLSSRPKTCFVVTNRCLWRENFCRDKNHTCGSSRQS